MRFSHAFDGVFVSEGATIRRTPVRAPNANAYAERWVGSIRRECLDRLLIFNRRQLDRSLRVYVRFCNSTVRTERSTCARRRRPSPRQQPRRRVRLRGTSNATTCSADSSTSTEQRLDPSFCTRRVRYGARERPAKPHG